MNQKYRKQNSIYADQSYLENVNLVTGATINYDRVLASDKDIKLLCIDDQLSPKEKFLQILEHENNMQIWSIFENLPSYITQDSIQDIFENILKKYSDFPAQLLPILGQGIYLVLSEHQEPFSSKVKANLDYIFRRVLQFGNSVLLEDWISAISMFYKRGYQIEEYLTFISGSFSMNATPERRLMGFQIIKSLIDVHIVQISKHPSIPLQDIKSKLSFFNGDRNPKTRKVICEIAEKLVVKFPKDEQLWKIIWQYFGDNDQYVSKTAAKIISNHYNKSNFPNFLNELENVQKTFMILTYFQSFIANYAQDFEDKKSKNKLIAFINRILKKQDQNQLQLLMINLNNVFNIIPQGLLLSQLSLQKLKIENAKTIKSLTILFNKVKQAQSKKRIKAIIINGLKSLLYAYFQAPNQIVNIFELSNEDQDKLVYLNLCNKMLQNSKWHCLECFVPLINKLRMQQNIYEKACLFLLKLFLNCPYFLVEQVITAVLYMMLTNRKSLQFLITLREKLMNSKCWTHRRNYLMLYCAIKTNSSFEFQKLIPIMLYKNLLFEKSTGLKLQFLDRAFNVYICIHPESNEKNLIKETVEKLKHDKDPLVAEKAEQVLQCVRGANSSKIIFDAYQKNKQFQQKQALLTQVQQQPRKNIKTQKNLRTSIRKKPDVKTTLNLTKQQVSIRKKSKQRSLVVGEQSKKSIFRCNSVKVKVPIEGLKKRL